VFYLETDSEIMIVCEDIRHSILLDLEQHVEFTLQIIISSYSWIDSAHVGVELEEAKKLRVK
jgi:hypothetical protein